MKKYFVCQCPLDKYLVRKNFIKEKRLVRFIQEKKKTSVDPMPVFSPNHLGQLTYSGMFYLPFKNITIE